MYIYIYIHNINMYAQAVEQGGGVHDAHDIFSAFFGGGMGGRGRQQRGPKKGEDRECTVCMYVCMYVYIYIHTQPFRMDS